MVAEMITTNVGLSSVDLLIELLPIIIPIAMVLVYLFIAVTAGRDRL